MVLGQAELVHGEGSGRPLIAQILRRVPVGPCTMGGGAFLWKGLYDKGRDATGFTKAIRPVIKATESMYNRDLTGF